MVVERHGDLRGVAAGADLVQRVEIDQRLLQHRIAGAGLAGGGERAGRGIAIGHVHVEAEPLLDLCEKRAEARMRRRWQRGHHRKAVVVTAAHELAAGAEAKRHHVVDRVAGGRDFLGGGKFGVEIAEQRLDEERVVIGGAMPYLHRRPHRFGDPGPGRVDDIARRRAGDEHPRQIEQQGRVLVAARVQPGQRHLQFAAAAVGVTEQIEGGIGRDETIALERAEQMRAAGADRGFDVYQSRQLARRADRLRLGMRQRDRVEQLRDRRADRLPIGLGVVARGEQRVAQRAKPDRVVQLGQAGAAQQRPQRRIAKRGAIEIGEMIAAALWAQQRAVADVIERGAVLDGGQRAIGCAGHAENIHLKVQAIRVFSSARWTRPPLRQSCKPMLNRTNHRQ